MTEILDSGERTFPTVTQNESAKRFFLWIEAAGLDDLTDIFPIKLRLAPRCAQGGVKFESDQILGTRQLRRCAFQVYFPRALDQFFPSRLFDKHQVDRRPGLLGGLKLGEGVRAVEEPIPSFT